MSKVTFFKFADSVTIFIGTRSYSVIQGDYRYDGIMKKIEDGELETIESILDPSKLLGDSEFSVSDGFVKYRDELIPPILGDQFFKFKMDKVSFISLVNFWLNMKTRAGYSASRDVILELIKNNGYPFKKDGFIIVHGGAPDSSLNKTAIKFYSYQGITAEFLEKFRKKTDYLDFVVEVFGFYSKKLDKAVTARLFKENATIDDSVLQFGSTFRNILSKEKLIEAVEAVKFNTLPGFSPLQAAEFYGAFPEKRVMALLKSERSWQECHTVVHGFGALGHLTLPSLKISSWTDVAEFYSRELKKLEDGEFDISVEKSFPLTSQLKMTIDGRFVILFPEKNSDLRNWSSQMNNCIHGYGHKILSGKTLVMAIINRDQEMLYNISITARQISEFKGRYNRIVDREDERVILDHLVAAGLIDPPQVITEA